MAKDNPIKEFLFSIKKELIRVGMFYSKLIRIMKRKLFNNSNITSENCFEVPIIINNRNRFTYLKMMINQLQSFGYNNIYIIDNASTYPPLLEYYKSLNIKIFYLNQNVGYKALWESDVFNQFKNNYYVYSDPDILLDKDCPKDFVYQLYKNLNAFTWKEKAGVALKIDDIPDSYKHQKEIYEWEKINWQITLGENIYDALVDTTLALYKPFAFGNAEECAAIRVAGKLTAQHLPWYIDSEKLSEEELYYRNNISKTSAYWSNK